MDDINKNIHDVAVVLGIQDGVLSNDGNVSDDETINKLDTCDRVKGGENVILYGVPGCGKSYTINKDYIDGNTKQERVVFHPDYTYGDFIGQIMPKCEDGNVSYQFSEGPFTRILKNAFYNPNIKYVLVVEEINRGNAPAIFGDIFQLLDRDDDGRSVYEITNADIAKYVYDDENHKVYIPSNLSIVCTMNTSDQNVFTLDTAFQRRWNMRLIKNEFTDDGIGQVNICDTNVTWKKFCETINDLILVNNQNTTSSEDKRLGTHFVSKKELSDPERFSQKVIKYLWDDAFKICRDEVFRDDLRSLDKVIASFINNSSDDRFDIFADAVKESLK